MMSSPAGSRSGSGMGYSSATVQAITTHVQTNQRATAMLLGHDRFLRIVQMRARKGIDPEFAFAHSVSSFGASSCQVSHGFTSNITSNSTGEPSARLPTPKTSREETYGSPKTSRNSSDAASATFGCSVNSGVAAT